MKYHGVRDTEMRKYGWSRGPGGRQGESHAESERNPRRAEGEREPESEGLLPT